jgi:hypothetical protein
MPVQIKLIKKDIFSEYEQCLKNNINNINKLIHCKQIYYKDYIMSSRK